MDGKWEIEEEEEEETDSDSDSDSYSTSEETANSRSQFRENSNGNLDGMTTDETEVQGGDASQPSSVNSEQKIKSFYQEELYIVLTLLREMCSYNDVMIEVTTMKRYYR